MPVYIHMHVWYVSICAWYVYMHACMHACIHVDSCMHACMYAHACAHMFSRMHACIHAFIYTRIALHAKKSGILFSMLNSIMIAKSLVRFAYMSRDENESTHVQNTHTYA
jgi:hypothetical protein